LFERLNPDSPDYQKNKNAHLQMLYQVSVILISPIFPIADLISKKYTKTSTVVCKMHEFEFFFRLQASKVTNKKTEDSK